MTITIKSRRGGAVLYESARPSLREALAEAVKAGANLYGANLDGANLRGAGITFDAGPSGRGWLIRLDAEGRYQPDAPWLVSIGCWRDHPLDDLRDLIEDRADWPEAEGAECDRRRPYLRAVLALCEAHIAYQEAVAAA